MSQPLHVLGFVCCGEPCGYHTQLHGQELQKRKEPRVQDTQDAWPRLGGVSGTGLRGATARARARGTDFCRASVVHFSVAWST